jgi:hypothetical protein
MELCEPFRRLYYRYLTDELANRLRGFFSGNIKPLLVLDFFGIFAPDLPASDGCEPNGWRLPDT